MAIKFIDGVNIDGNVGIGTTSPTMPLTLSVDVDTEGVEINGSSASYRGLLNTHELYLYNKRVMRYNAGMLKLGDAADDMVINGGNVGIGTDSPSVPLEVYNDSTTTLPLIRVKQDGTGDASIGFNTIGSTQYSIGIDNSDSDKFKISRSTNLGTSTQITIDSAGAVGIGTSGPTQKLHVNGNLRVTGAYYDSNNSSGTSGQVLSSTATGTDWVTPTTGDITGVTAGTGMTGGGTSGTVTLNVIGGTGITANANDIAIDATVLTTTGSQTISGAKRFNGSILDAGGSSGTSGQVLASTGTGQVDWVAAASGTIGGTAADTRIAFGSAANTLTSDPDFEVVTSVSGAKRIKVENGGIQIANMSIGASLATVGSMRYRAVAGIKNISYVDMVMQTAGTVGAVGGTYAWVNIVQNTWN